MHARHLRREPNPDIQRGMSAPGHLSMQAWGPERNIVGPESLDGKRPHPPCPVGYRRSPTAPDNHLFSNTSQVRGLQRIRDAIPGSGSLTYRCNRDRAPRPASGYDLWPCLGISTIMTPGRPDRKDLAASCHHQAPATDKTRILTLRTPSVGRIGGTDRIC